jgi:spore germination protein YaaH
VIWRILVIGLSLATLLPGQTKALFYMQDSPAAVRSFQANAARIDIIVPTVYSADGDGLVWGEPNPVVVDTARLANVRLMPIIVNSGFNQNSIHALLANPAARRRMIASLVSECQKHSYYGIQFDFENVSYLDRDALTKLVAEASAALGQAGFKLSIAVVPSPSDYPGRSDYSRWVFANWRGAYDLKAIGPLVDFVSLMTYDQHTRNTPPGPVAGLPWTELLLDAAVKLVSRDKLSLGIPLYGRRWYSAMRDKDPAVTAGTINTADALDLASAMKVPIQWDEVEHAPWFYFYRDGLREYVFYNDAHAFRDRYELARRSGLHGISAWVLGLEDPQIWKELPARPGN